MESRLKKSLSIAGTFVALAMMFVSFQNFSSSVQAITFTVSTSQPNTNLFAIGDNVILTFKASGQTSTSSGSTVLITVKDEFGQILQKGKIILQKNSSNEWTGNFTALSAKMGFYQVYATLYSGDQQIPLPALGSRPAGYFTYAIVPSPAKRPDVQQSKAFFGLQGEFSQVTESIVPLLGVRWVLGNLSWQVYSPNSADEFIPPPAANKNSILPYNPSYQGKPWTVYPIPTLYQNPPTKWIDNYDWEQRCQKWRDYIKKAATLYMNKFGNLESRVYQITWEPNDPNQFKGTTEQLIDWHRIAYETLHEVDPKAVVIGPTAATVAPYFFQWHQNIISPPPPTSFPGIWNYVDGYGVHAYTVNPNGTLAQSDLANDQNLLLNGLGMLRNLLDKVSSRYIPIYSTEAGHATTANQESELVHARNLIEHNVIMYGEKVRLSLAFYLNDYSVPSGFGGFGLFYNLTNNKPQYTANLSPKPAVPAYAAMTYFLENSTSLGKADFGAGTRAYIFQNGSKKIYVIWTLTDSPVNISVQGVQVYDWMGNLTQSIGKTAATVSVGALTQSISKTAVTVSVGPQPVYLVAEQQ